MFMGPVLMPWAIQDPMGCVQECNDRVNSRKQTEETCHEEVIHYFHCLDHCVPLPLPPSPFHLFTWPFQTTERILSKLK